MFTIEAKGFVACFFGLLLKLLIEPLSIFPYYCAVAVMFFDLGLRPDIPSSLFIYAGCIAAYIIVHICMFLVAITTAYLGIEL